MSKHNTEDDTFRLLKRPTLDELIDRTRQTADEFFVESLEHNGWTFDEYVSALCHRYNT